VKAIVFNVFMYYVMLFSLCPAVCPVATLAFIFLAHEYIYIYTGLISMKFGQANIATIFRVKKLIAIAT